MKLILDNLACERGGRRLFSALSRRIGAGEGLLVEGPNGTGKTTLLKTIAGLLRPTAGSTRLEGGGAEESLGEQCHLIGHLPGVKRALSVAENYRFWTAYLGKDAGAEPDEEGLARLGLADLADLPAGVLSAGQRRRLALARLYAAPRPVWLLDEPAEALDAASKRLLARMIGNQLEGGGIVVAVSHTALRCKFAQSLRLGSPARRPAARARR